MMRSSFLSDDVTLLLKDVSGLVEPMSSVVREPLIQSGVHYSEMLPLEYAPTTAYMKAFDEAMMRFAKPTAIAIRTVAEEIVSRKGANVVLVSLARAGIPIGILLKRYLDKNYSLKVPHYAISIIRDRGMDLNALRHILARHNPTTLQFVDGWTGKGVIQHELILALKSFPDIDPSLAVLSDPAGVSEVCGTQDDFLVPSACLNSTICGLISRTILRSDLIGPSDFHGAVFYKHLRSSDLTYSFINGIEAWFDEVLAEVTAAAKTRRPLEDGVAEAQKIAKDFEIEDIKLVKPGIGEATRVLLRRIPWKLLVWSKDDASNLGHLYQLAKERGVEVEVYPLKNYRACGLIKKVTDS